MTPRLSFVLAVVVLAVVVLAGVVPVGATAEPAAVPARAHGAVWAAPLAGEPDVARRLQAPPHRYGPGHRGLDLAAVPGAPVLAAGDGVVVFAGMVAGRPVLSIDHAGGLRTTYEPVQPSVRAGMQVLRGAPLGVLLAGHEGCPAPACLHWGVRRGEDYLDPLLLLRPPRVRLLPLGDAVTPAAGPARSSTGRAPRAVPTAAGPGADVDDHRAARSHRRADRGAAGRVDVPAGVAVPVGASWKSIGTAPPTWRGEPRPAAPRPSPPAS